MVIGWIEIAFELVSAFGGIISSRRPSGEVIVPPVASIVAETGLPTGVPTAVGVPFDVSGGAVEEDLHDAKNTEEQTSKVKRYFIDCAFK